MVFILLNCVSCTVENNGDSELDSDIIGQLSCLDYSTLSFYKDATLAKNIGYIVGKLLNSFSCEECPGALVTNDKTIGFLLLLEQFKTGRVGWAHLPIS